MSFPYNDPHWTSAADFVDRHRGADDTILAPDIFWMRFDHIYRYANTSLKPAQMYDWAILHKGELKSLSDPFMESIESEMWPVFANEVFVTWARMPSIPRLDPSDSHLSAYYGRRAELRNGSTTDNAATTAPIEDPVLPDPGSITRFAYLDEAAKRKMMDDFFRNGGYRYDTVRDKVYYAEIDRWVRILLGRSDGLRILDVCCGDGRVANVVTSCEELVNSDFAEVAVRSARTKFAGRDGLRFAVMDAQMLPLPDRSFDVVTFIDASEHVGDISRALDEISRVTRPGGRLICTGANRNSLNQIVNRKLGFPEFLTNYQHIREFTFDEFTALLVAAGFEIERSGSILLYPYWGIPGIDEIVRHIMDEDEEMVEVTRVLGERAGPEYAYTFIVSARKVSV